MVSGPRGLPRRAQARSRKVMARWLRQQALPQYFFKCSSSLRSPCGSQTALHRPYRSCESHCRPTAMPPTALEEPPRQTLSSLTSHRRIRPTALFRFQPFLLGIRRRARPRMQPLPAPWIPTHLLRCCVGRSSPFRCTKLNLCSGRTEKYRSADEGLRGRLVANLLPISKLDSLPFFVVDDDQRRSVHETVYRYLQASALSRHLP